MYIGKIITENKWFILIGLLIFLIYSRILWGYFQQDEWLSIAYKILTSHKSLVSQFVEFFSPSVGHYQPFTSLVLQTQFYLFKLNYIGYAVVSIFLHIINIWLIFILSVLLWKNKAFALKVALLFGVSASIYQSTSWVMADIGVHLSTAFALGCLIYFLKFLQSKRKGFYFLSLALLIVALLFKESVIGLFLFLPLLYLLLNSANSFNFKFKLNFYLLTIVLVALLYLVVRLFMVTFPQSFTKDSLVTQSQPLKYLILNVLALPLIGIPQSIISQSLLQKVAYLLAPWFPFQLTNDRSSISYNLFVQGKLTDLICLAVFIFLVIITLSIVLKKRKTQVAKTAIFGFSLAFINLPIFALAPERAGFISIIDSRNLYFVCVGSTILTVVLLSQISSKYLRNFIFITLLVVNIYYLNLQLASIVNDGQIRIEILNKIKSEYPKLADKTIFYTLSDKSYYGLPEDERILPFQSGFGQTLLVWYFLDSNLPPEFLENKFLWGIKDQGYKEIKNRGFGYFRDFKLLDKELKEDPNLSQAIIAYRFDSSLNSIYNITAEVRGSAEGYLTKKKIIDSKDLKASASDNSKDIYLAFDHNPLTSWISKDPYHPNQYLDIDLGESKKIAQIRINSGNNKDQNQVGYQLLVSNDTKTFSSAFYALKYPPDESGTLDIYFKPQQAKMLRLVQLGNHEKAFWQINEINVYQVLE